MSDDKEDLRNKYNMSEDELRKSFTAAQRICFDELFRWKYVPSAVMALAVLTLSSLAFLLGRDFDAKPDVSVRFSEEGGNAKNKDTKPTAEDRKAMMQNPALNAAFRAELQKAADAFAKTGEQQLIYIPVRRDAVYAPQGVAAKPKP